MSSSSGGGVSQAAGLAAQFGISIPTTQSETKWVYPEIINSRTLARSILKRKFDTIEFGKQKSLLQILTYGNGEPSYGKDILEIKAVDSFLGMIEISEDLKTGILTLKVNASDPNLAAKTNEKSPTPIFPMARFKNAFLIQAKATYYEASLTQNRKVRSTVSPTAPLANWC